MNIREYENLYRQLNSHDDVERLAADEGYDKELLFVVFTEKHVRNIKRDFYKVKNNTRRLLDRWHGGHSFTRLAQEINFSPLMMANILMKEKGMTKKDVQHALRDADAIKDARLRREIHEAMDEDSVYSEEGARIQKARGIEGEATIAKWLEDRGITYKTEDDLKGKTEHGKTVDFLLDTPITIQFEDGPKEINWIESKGSFGDNKKMMRDYTKQLQPYTKYWGPGVVVYWFGFLEGMEMWLEPRDVMPVRREWFGKHGEMCYQDPNIPKSMKCSKD